MSDPLTHPGALPLSAATASPVSPWRHLATGLRRHPLVWVSLLLLLIVGILAAIAPWLPVDPYTTNFAARLQPPSADAWLGTDQLGRDVLARLLAGSRIALVVGFLSVGIGLVVGGILGLVAGMNADSWLDTAIMRAMDIIIAFPWLLLVIAVIAILGPSIPNVMIAIGLTLIPEFARLVRSMVLSLRQQDFVTAARSLGASPWRIALHHVLPHCAAHVMVLGTVKLGRSILAEAGLSYLGLGVQPPHPSWGSMIANGQDYLLSAPHLSLIPGVAVMLVVMALNLAGDGLRDALDPKGIQRVGS